MQNKALTKDRLRIQIYTDAERAIARWRDSFNIKLYVFSHSDATTVKLFLQHTNFGDMSKYFTDFFGPRSNLGPKNQPQAYENLSKQIGIPPDRIAYITKNGTEAVAALNAGLEAILCMTHTRDLRALEKDPALENYWEVT